MKTGIFVFFFLMVNVAGAQSHDHHRSHHAKSNKPSGEKKQFVPTKDLKIRMEKVLALVKELNLKKNDLKIVKEYGVKLTDTVGDIFKTCKLEPDADAAIHPSLGLILDGAKDFKRGEYESGHEKIHKALLAYEELFKHDGWSH